MWFVIAKWELKKRSTRLISDRSRVIVPNRKLFIRKKFLYGSRRKGSEINVGVVPSGSN